MAVRQLQTPPAAAIYTHSCTETTNINLVIVYVFIMCQDAIAVSCGYDTWFAVRLVMDYTISRVHFGESLVNRLYSEIDHTYLSIEAQCVSHHHPRWTATRGKYTLAPLE